MQQSVSYIQIRNLTIEVGTFTGNIEHIKLFISQYLTEHGFTMESNGYGFGSITIGETRHEYTPHGININMMLEWIPDDFADFDPIIALGVDADNKSALSDFGVTEERLSCNII